jgi:hypothetical protein
MTFSRSLIVVSVVHTSDSGHCAWESRPQGFHPEHRVRGEGTAIAVPSPYPSTPTGRIPLAATGPSELLSGT